MDLLGIILQAESESGSAIGKILANIPRDPAAIVVYILLAVCAYFIWIGSKARNESGNDAERDTAK